MAESKPAPRIEAHTMNSASSRILYHVSCYQLATDAETRRDSRETLLRS